MRRTKTANPRPGESQDAPQQKTAPPRRYKSRWELEQDRAINHMRGSGCSQRCVVEGLRGVAIGDFNALLALAETAGPFHLYTDERYRELGL